MYRSPFRLQVFDPSPEELFQYAKKGESSHNTAMVTARIIEKIFKQTPGCLLRGIQNSPLKIAPELPV